MKELEQEALKWQNEQNRLGTGLALGLCLGCALGISFDTLSGSSGTGLCFGLCFGLLCTPPYFFIGGWTLAFSWWVAGIPFDLLHCVFNFAIVLVLFPPLNKLFARLQERNMLL